MMSDTDGQYPAIIRAMNLYGIQTFSVRDQYAHPKPKGIQYRYNIYIYNCMYEYNDCFYQPSVILYGL